MEKFLAIALPEPTVLLGRKLRPLSLGHLLYLERFGCLPANDPDKLVLATIICASRFEDILPTLTDPWRDWRISVWRWRIGEPDWQSKYKIWEDYFSAHTSGPSVINKKERDSAEMSGTPFYQHLKVTLQAKLNYTPAEAINCPFGQALFDYYAFHEMEGNVEVCDQNARQEMRDRADADHDALVAQVIQESAERAKKGGINGSA